MIARDFAALYRIIEADHPPPGDGRW